MLYLFLGKSKHWHRKKTIHYKLVPFESGNELFMNPLKKKYYWRSFSFSNFDAEKKCPISSPKYFYRDRISTFLWFGVFKQNDILTTTFHYKLDYLRCVIQHGLSLEGSDLLSIPWIRFLEFDSFCNPSDESAYPDSAKTHGNIELSCVIYVTVLSGHCICVYVLSFLYDFVFSPYLGMYRPYMGMYMSY